MKKFQYLLSASLFGITLQAQAAGLMDGFMQGYNNGQEIQLRDEQIKTLRMQRQLIEEQRKAPSEQQPSKADVEQWWHDVAAFKKYVKANEGIDYDANLSWNDALDAEIKRLANDPKNAQQDSTWFLVEAHKNVKRRLSIK